MKGNHKHHMSHSPEHDSWLSAKQRCLNPNDRAYSRYGGRGIKFSERWMVFLAFYEDMGPRPLGMELDRIDNNGNYEPGNCRWATPQQQANNRRSNRWITFNGKTQTVMQWSRETGIKRTTIEQRLDSCGYSVQKALTKRP
jgi:hypothetical protein